MATKSLRKRLPRPTEFASKMPLKERNAKVYDYEDDGDYLSVEFTRENGERVIGCYKRVGWSHGPAEFNADIERRLSLPAVAIHYPHTRGTRPGSEPAKTPSAVKRGAAD